MLLLCVLNCGVLVRVRVLYVTLTVAPRMALCQWRRHTVCGLCIFCRGTRAFVRTWCWPSVIFVYAVLAVSTHENPTDCALPSKRGKQRFSIQSERSVLDLMPSSLFGSAIVCLFGSKRRLGPFLC